MKSVSNKNNNQSSTCAIGIIDNQLAMSSTPVENVRQIGSFLQNEPNFLSFSPKNEDSTKKQTQTNPNKLDSSLFGFVWVRFLVRSSFLGEKQ